MTTVISSEERFTYNVAEAAARLGISENSLRTALHNPSEPITKITLRVGKRILISRRGLSRLLEAGAAATAQPEGK